MRAIVCNTYRSCANGALNASSPTELFTGGGACLRQAAGSNAPRDGLDTAEANGEVGRHESEPAIVCVAKLAQQARRARLRSQSA